LDTILQLTMPGSGAAVSSTPGSAGLMVVSRALQVTAQTTLEDVCAALPKCIDMQLDLRGHSIAPSASAPRRATSSFSLVQLRRTEHLSIEEGSRKWAWQERVDMPTPLLGTALTILTLGQWRRHGRRKHPCWTLAGAAHMLHNGTLQLPEGGQLWLEGRGLRLEGLTISGAFPCACARSVGCFLTVCRLCTSQRCTHIWSDKL
jgi:hypothetical protein